MFFNILSTLGTWFFTPEENYSREISPYWKYDKYNLDNWDGTECKTELRFAKSHPNALLNVLGFRDKFVCSQRTVCNGMEWSEVK